MRTQVRDIVTDTWQRILPINFTGWGTCSNANAGNQIVIWFADTNGSFTGRFGSFPNLPTNVQFDSVPGLVRYHVVHEFGHALGFLHDQQRPDNWKDGSPVYCPNLQAGQGSVAGGQEFTKGDNASVMSYCSPNPGWLAPSDVLGTRAAYGKQPGGAACQRLSDIYGIDSNVTWSFAPQSVKDLWTNQSCNTHPSSPDACQKASDLYGIEANVTWGFAPSTVQTWWANNNCNTKPLAGSMGGCQRISETFGTTRYVSNVSNVDWGTAPGEVQSYWSSHLCLSAPRRQDTCQRMADLYGITAGVDWGWAPQSVQSWWVEQQCDAKPIPADRCQLLSDRYGIQPGVTFGAAPQAARDFWVASNCNVVPKSTNACQRAADLYAINPGVSWGFAPQEVRDWWVSTACSAKPRSSDSCQVMSDRYGIIPGISWGAAPSDVQSWWVSQVCDRRPKDALPIPG